MTDNPFNRTDPEPGNWMVVCRDNRGPNLPDKYEPRFVLATSSAFAHENDAMRYARTVDQSRYPMICQLRPAFALFTKERPDYGDSISVEDFRECVSSGGFIDYDGHGYPERDGKHDPNYGIFPSDMLYAPGCGGVELPPGTTHILWFNR